MKYIYLNIYLYILILFLGCQSNQDENNITQEGIQQSISIELFEKLDLNNPEDIVAPFKLTRMDDSTFAVFDVELNKVFIYSDSGEEQYSFGSTGSGPGEWSEGGPVNLHYLEGKFIVSDSNRLQIFLYDRNGLLLDEITVPGHLKYSNKLLISSEKLLVASNGYENSLAIILDLRNDGNILERIGNTENSITDHLNLAEIREALSNKEIPEALMNEALVTRNSKGIVVFLNAMGEIIHFDKEGNKLWNAKLPLEITGPIQNYIAQKNNEARGANAYMSLKYAIKVTSNDNGIYILTSNFMDDIDISQYIISYDLDGIIQSIIKIDDPSSQSYISDFIINNNKIIMSNPYNSEILYINNSLLKKTSL